MTVSAPSADPAPLMFPGGQAVSCDRGAGPQPALRPERASARDVLAAPAGRTPGELLQAAFTDRIGITWASDAEWSAAAEAFLRAVAQGARAPS